MIRFSVRDTIHNILIISSLFEKRQIKKLMDKMRERERERERERARGKKIEGKTGYSNFRIHFRRCY